MDFNFYMECDFFDESVMMLIRVYGFTPSRPAPACSNPSSPRFSDPGDGAEFEDYDVFFILKKNGVEYSFDAGKLPEEVEEWIFEEIIKRGEEHGLDDY